VKDSDLATRLAVYLVADPEAVRPGRDLLDDVAAAIEGGVTAVQLRGKRLSGYDTWLLARRLRELCRERNVLYFVNDRVDVAIATRADGVHLGMSDVPLGVARELGGAAFVIGASPRELRQAADAGRQGANYVGVGPVFPTSSKADAQPPIGLEGVSAQAAAAGLPSVGIGGITSENAAAVIAAGAAGVAVISAILGADDPRLAAARLVEVVGRAKGARLATPMLGVVANDREN